MFIKIFVLSLIISFLYVSSIENYYLKKSFINNIDTDNRNYKVEKCFELFVELGGKNAVKYHGERPINIYSYIPDRENELGLADVHVKKCYIYLSKNLTDDQFCDILFHEYMHCLGFNHSEVRFDLMYKYWERPINIDNIRKYAKEANNILK